MFVYFLCFCFVLFVCLFLFCFVVVFCVFLFILFFLGVKVGGGEWRDFHVVHVIEKYYRDVKGMSHSKLSDKGILCEYTRHPKDESSRLGFIESVHER